MALSESIKQIAIFDKCIQHHFLSSTLRQIGLKREMFFFFFLLCSIFQNRVKTKKELGEKFQLNCLNVNDGWRKRWVASSLKAIHTCLENHNYHCKPAKWDNYRFPVELFILLVCLQKKISTLWLIGWSSGLNVVNFQSLCSQVGCQLLLWLGCIIS